MFLFRETDIKLCKNYTKTLYIRFCIKVVVLNRSYSTNIQRYCTAIGGSSGEVMRIYTRSYSTNIQRYCTAIGGSSGEVMRIYTDYM